MDGGNIGQDRLDLRQLAPLVEAGYTLLPLHRWNAVTKCARTDKKRLRGKSPIHRNWTTRLFKNEDALVHARTGKNVGVRLTAEDLVVDVDPRHIAGGMKSASKTLRDLGVRVKEFPTVRTGSGGAHIYMRKPAGMPLLDHLPGHPGIELKSLGRQVVAPGSRHPNGKPYAWQWGEDELFLGAPAAPDGLLVAAKRATRTKRPVGEGVGEHPPTDIANILEHMDPTNFQDHDMWLSLMMACHHASAGEAVEEFVAWSTQDPLFA